MAKIGAVLVPINTRFRTSDLEYVLRQSDSTTLITVDRSGPVDFLDMTRQVCPEIEHGDANDKFDGSLKKSLQREPSNLSMCQPRS